MKRMSGSNNFFWGEVGENIKNKNRKNPTSLPKISFWGKRGKKRLIKWTKVQIMYLIKILYAEYINPQNSVKNKLMSKGFEQTLHRK